MEKAVTDFAIYKVGVNSHRGRSYGGMTGEAIRR